VIIRIVQAKGRKDRHVMLPAEVLDLLRQWWKARPTKHDAGVAPEQRWLFPGRSERWPLTTRQFGRLFKEAAKAAGLRKTISLHTQHAPVARREAVPVVNRRDPRATRRALAADAASRAGGPC
jgi:site-specific recombinase XerD